METFYLIDFENVHNDGIVNIENLKKTDHIHVFSTENATNIRSDIFWLNKDIKSHLVPVRKQSLDMHLVSYLGYLLGVYGKECSYVIISKDKDYDNIVKFWKEEGYPNISRKERLPGNASVQKKTKQNSSQNTTWHQSTASMENGKISGGMNCKLDGKDRCELNIYMQHSLVAKGYENSLANRICKYVIAHCNDEKVLNAIHNNLREEIEDYLTVYEDVKAVLKEFTQSKRRPDKREAQIRSFFGKHFKKKIYVDSKEEIIQVILNAKSKQEVNNGLLKLYADGNVVSHIYKTVQPLIAELPGR